MSRPRRTSPSIVRRMWLAVERRALGTAMSVVAFVVERRLLKAIRSGGVQAAPRTAAEGDALEAEAGGETPTGELT